MTQIQKLLSDRIMEETIEDVSRLYFPKYWSLQDRAEAAEEAKLAEALTKHDQPCMSY
jgi:hypothetical protein